MNALLVILIFIVYPIFFFSRSNLVNVNEISLTPSLTYIAGTDSLGRDFFLRCIQGAYLSLVMAILGLLLSHIIGFIIGSLATFKKFKINFWLPRLIDLFDALPSYLVVCVLAICWQQVFVNFGVLSKSILSLILSMAMVSWMSIARIVRLEILQLLDQEYILNAKIMGANFIQLIKSHFYKYTIKILVISMVQKLPHFILMESFLSYLGIGIVPPYLSLGGLIAEGWRYAYLRPILFLVPSMFLVLISLQFKLILSRFNRLLS
ncbi:MAG: ABC transporter permease, partial [Bdellovibrionales bacterium]|nr:ABC transporter permease [Bdellovibrionales bacterium]